MTDEDGTNCCFWWWRDEEDRRLFFICMRPGAESCFGDYARGLDGFAVVDDFGELVRVPTR
jgi:hypothetical protein